MAIIITITTYVGVYLDELYPPLAPWSTVGLSLFGVGTSLYYVIKQVTMLSVNE